MHMCSTQIAESVTYSGLLKVTVSPSTVESAHVESTTGTSGAATAKQSRARFGRSIANNFLRNRVSAYHL